MLIGANLLAVIFTVLFLGVNVALLRTVNRDS